MTSVELNRSQMVRNLVRNFILIGITSCDIIPPALLNCTSLFTDTLSLSLSYGLRMLFSFLPSNTSGGFRGSVCENSRLFLESAGAFRAVWNNFIRVGFRASISAHFHRKNRGEWINERHKLEPDKDLKKLTKTNPVWQTIATPLIQMRQICWMEAFTDV